jgi:hypothetical protein
MRRGVRGKGELKKTNSFGLKAATNHTFSAAQPKNRRVHCSWQTERLLALAKAVVATQSASAALVH